MPTRRPNATLTVTLLGLLLAPLAERAHAGPDAVVTEWRLPTNARANRSIAFSAACGCAFYADASRGRIGRLEPETGVITEWELPASEYADTPWRLLPDPDGGVYFSTFAPVMGHLDPQTGTVTIWPIPRAETDPDPITLYELDFDSAGRVWVMGNNNHTLYRLDRRTNVVTSYPIPHDEPYSTQLQVDDADRVFWIGARDTNSISVLDPATNLYVEWSVPSWVPGSVEPSRTSFPTGLLLRSDDELMFMERSANKLARLDLATNVFTEWTMPTVATPPPSVLGDPGAGLGEMVAASASGDLFFTETWADRIGAFDPASSRLVEWQLPPARRHSTAARQRVFPNGIAIAPDCRVFYVTGFSNRIGVLRPSGDECRPASSAGTPSGVAGAAEAAPSGPIPIFPIDTLVPPVTTKTRPLRTAPHPRRTTAAGLDRTVPQRSRSMKTISVRDLGVLQLSIHDLFSVNRVTGVDEENRKLDLSQVLGHGADRIALGGDPRNQGNVIVLTMARRFGQRYLDLVASGAAPDAARTTVTAEYLAELRRAYEATFDEPFPSPGPFATDQTANLALRTLHDLNPGWLEIGGQRVRVTDAALAQAGTTLTDAELMQHSSTLDGRYYIGFRAMRVFNTHTGQLEDIDLLERDRSFATEFGTAFPYDHFLAEVRDGRYDPGEDVTRVIRELYASAQ